MTLQQLRYFVAIADSGLNITLAAERVHATQPGLSKQLKQLEDELGMLLFTRRGKSLESITDGGNQVLASARAMLAEAGNIRALAANLRQEAGGELRIATTHTQARFLLPSALAEVKRRYPDVVVRLTPAGDAEVLPLLVEGEADLAIVSTVGPPPSGGLAVPLYRWERVLIVPKGHALAASGQGPTLTQLAQHPLISYESSLRRGSSLRQVFMRAELEPRFALTARDADLITTYVRAGLGVGILAEMAFTAEDAQDLVALDIGTLLPSCTTWLVMARDRVQRDYALQLARALAPQLDVRDLRRALNGEPPERWPDPPHWRERAKASGPL